MMACSEHLFLCYVLELRGVRGACGESGSGLRGFDELSWDEPPWNRERVSRRSPSCKLLGLCCFSEGVWEITMESKDSGLFCEIVKGTNPNSQLSNSNSIFGGYGFVNSLYNNLGGGDVLS